MFRAYSIEFSAELLERVKKYAIFPTDKPSKAVEIQDIPGEADCQTLQLRKSVSLHELDILMSEAMKFLHPVKQYLPFFDHFHLKSSQLFAAYMSQHMPQSGNATVEHLKKALPAIHADIEVLLKGKTTRQSLMLRSIDDKSIQEEIEKIISYRDFTVHKDSKIIQHISNAMMVPGVIEGVKCFLQFCKSFELEVCIKSEQYCRLQELCEEVDDASIQQITLEEATKTVDSIKEVLESSGQVVRLEHLSAVFQVLSVNSSQLKDFFIENNFTTKGEGQHWFQQKYELVTQQLQHEEYNAEVLNNLYAVFLVLAPLNNHELTFSEVLEMITRMDRASIEAQFNTVRSNIDLIKTWFSRAEVYIVYLKCFYLYFIG